MCHLVYNVIYPVVTIKSSLLTITLYFSVITTLIYNGRKYPSRDVITDFYCVWLGTWGGVVVKALRY
jgi:hypothetical protein